MRHAESTQPHTQQRHTERHTANEWSTTYFGAVAMVALEVGVYLRWWLLIAANGAFDRLCTQMAHAVSAHTTRHDTPTRRHDTHATRTTREFDDSLHMPCIPELSAEAAGSGTSLCTSCFNSSAHEHDRW
jgi:hypothetical protein